MIEKIIQDLENSNLVVQKMYNEGDIIFNEGDDTHSLILIKSGSVVIEKAINIEKTDFKELAYITSPSFIGEIALFEETKRTARARALTQVQVIEISREDFKKLISQNLNMATEILSEIIKTLAKRLSHTSLELALLYDITKHLAKTYTEEKEFLKNVLNEISMYLAECEIECFYYNPFNNEFEKIFEINYEENYNIDPLKQTSSWIDDKHYTTILKQGSKILGYIVFSFRRKLTQSEIADYTTIFNTISYITISGLEKTIRNKEEFYLEKLKKRKYTL